jgi:hypothetical protein
LLSVNVNTSNSGNPFSVTGMSFVNSGTLTRTGRLYYTGASQPLPPPRPWAIPPRSPATGDTLTFASPRTAGRQQLLLAAYDVPADYAHLNQTLDATVCSVTIPMTHARYHARPRGDALPTTTVAPPSPYKPHLAQPHREPHPGRREHHRSVSMSTTPRLYYKKSTNADVFAQTATATAGNTPRVCRAKAPEL